MLKVLNLNCGYGESSVLRGLSFELKEGEVLSLIGPNGAGKTSGLLCLMGLVDCHEGDIFFKDKNITSLPSDKRILEGLAVVPEGRRIFPNLTVFENLMAGGHILTSEECEKGILKRNLEGCSKRKFGGNLKGTFKSKFENKLVLIHKNHSENYLILDF